MAEIKIECVEDILKLQDIKSMFKLFKQWGIKAPKTSDKKIVVEELVKFYRENGAISPVNKRTGGTVLQEALQFNRSNREKLIKLYGKVQSFYNDLPVNFQDDLNSIFNDVVKTAHQKQSELASPECNILVAGEATSGKSSLINLLLEANILPTSDIKCTQTICEIRKSRDGSKRAICVGVNNGPKAEIDISSRDGLNELGRCITYEDDYGDSPYEKIEIYWPTDTIEEGLVIIDTPGFGDNNMNKSLKKYLSKSCGFIYVVNTANAGGIQRGRLKDFLRNVVNSSDEDYSPSSTLFVCNKWDVVPIKDREKLQRDNVVKLEQIVNGIRTDQIFYFSTQEANRAVEYGTINAAHDDFITNGLQRLFPASLRQQLNSHYRWLSQILKRANYSLKVSKTLEAVDKEDLLKKMEEIKRNMHALEVRSRHTIDDLRNNLQYEIGDIHKSTADVLRAQNMLNILTSWENMECPKPDDTKKLAKEAAERITSKVAAEINRWEKEKRVVHSLKDKIVKKFKRDCELLEDQITEIEGTLIGHDKKIINDLHKSMKRQAPVKTLWKKAKKDGNADDIRGLGGAIASVGSGIASNKRFREIFKSYKTDNNSKKMSEATMMYIQTLFQGNEMLDKISNFLSKLVKGVDDIAKKIPEFVKADNQLLEQITNTMKERDDNLRKLYPQLIHQGHTVQGELDLFYVYYIMDMDFRLSDLQWNRDDLLGSGSFADVFKGTLSQRGKTKDVALKYCKDPLSEKVVSDILLEDRTLREIHYENIITYYGCVLQQTGKTKRNVHWIMIMEYCDDTLKSKFINPQYDNPAKVGDLYSVQIERTEELARYIIQICKGLEFLHNKKMVHRDMKLENILTVKVDGQDIVKLTDVGLTKREDNIGGSILGSPVYMAPEVLVPKGIYDRKADIYAVGIMIWEMWYGIDAADHIQQQLYTTLEKAVNEEGLRPSLTIKYKPDDNWKTLIESCWANDPEKRPEASDIRRFMETFLKAY